MFKTLEERDLKVVIDAMQEKRIIRGLNVITQGDDGDHLYFVEAGQLDCSKK